MVQRTKVQVYGLRLVRERTETYAASHTHTPEQAASILQLLIGDNPTEQFVVILLGSQNQVLGANVAAIGGRSTCQVEVASVFRAAIAGNAAAIIIGHNHPSGDPTPSSDDVEFTRKVSEAGKILGIAVLDHIVVTRDAYRSIVVK